MALKVLVLASLLALAFGEDFPISEETGKIMDDCEAEKNVSLDEVHKFIREKTEPTTQIKEYFLCVTQKLGTFDGMNWNREKMRELVKDESRWKKVEMCLTEDDVSLEPLERNFAMVKCSLEKELMMV